MKQLLIQLSSEPARQYPIFIGGEMLSQLETLLSASFPKQQLVIITDHHVRKIYGEALEQALFERGHRVLLLSFRAGERSKSAKTKAQLEEQMLQHRCGRDTLVLALGGGVVGDVAGFVAATYLRGVAYLQLPTTLLAMLDSSVGGKTGINTSHGKNLIGAYWQPSAVIADFSCLKTLPKKQFISGLIEAIKMFLTSEARHFYEVEENLDTLLAGKPQLLEQVMSAAVSIKMGVVERDEKESGERMILNFGHTIGHALEHVSHYKMMHGYAVALGILVEMKISELLGILSPEDYRSVRNFLERLKITPSLLKGINVSEVLAATKNDKKVRGGVARYVLLRRLGEVDKTGGAMAHPVNDEVVIEAFKKVTT